MFGSVAAESFHVTHFVGGTFHRVDTHLRKRARHVADTEPNNFRVGVFAQELRRTFADFREQIAAGELEIIFVDLRHVQTSLKLKIAARTIERRFRNRPLTSE